MEKRFFLALLLSFMVLMIYSSFAPKSKPVENKQVASETVDVATKSPAVPIPAEYQKQEATKSPYILENKELAYIYDTGKLQLTFSKKGAYIAEIYDKVTQTKIDFGAVGLDPEFFSYLFDVKQFENTLIFNYAGQNGLEIEKKFEFLSDYSFRLTVNLTNVGIKIYDVYNGKMTPMVKPDSISERYNETSVFSNNILLRKPAHSIKELAEYSDKILWAGIRDRYFCSVIYPQQIVNKVVIEKDSPFLVGQKVSFSLPDSPKTSLTFDYYVGPQKGNLLEKFKPGTELIVNYGAIDLVAKGLLFLINAAHSVTKNWGWSIILMTIFVFAVLSPLSIKSFVSMKRIQLLQPKMEELKVKFKDNPQKLHAETMELYRREKINPLGGCFPMLLQIPVFVSLYQLLMRLIDLKGAKFLWIKDLSQPDRLIVFQGQIPFLGNELNILPLLMAGTMFVQQKLTSSSAAVSKEAADQQKIMGIMMPIVFGVLFYKISSGLVLYWFVNSLLTLGFQWKISKLKIV